MSHLLTIAGPDNRRHALEQELFERCRDELHSIGVDYRRLHSIADDDPLRAEVDAILANYDGIFPTVPKPPGWVGHAPREWDGSLDDVLEYLKRAWCDRDFALMLHDDGHAARKLPL